MNTIDTNARERVAAAICHSDSGNPFESVDVVWHDEPNKGKYRGFAEAAMLAHLDCLKNQGLTIAPINVN